jgi:5'-nucleotidase
MNPSFTGRAAGRRPLILLTNDDGFFAEGLRSLQKGLRGLGQLVAVAPDREKSASSLSLTLHRPLRVQKTGPRVYAVDGTPADCVYIAVRKLLARPPDLLVSGVNRGPNLGQQDISYSGTAAAAVQGTYLGIPSLAVSLIPGEGDRYSFDFAARIVRSVVESLLAHAHLPGLTLNINIPPPPFRGVRITTLGEKRYTPEIVEKKDPRQNSYYWIGTGEPRPSGGPSSDIRAVAAGFVSVTPLRMDLTDYQTVRRKVLQSALAGVSAGDAGPRSRRGSSK